MKHIKILFLSLASSFGAFAVDINVSTGQLEGIINGNDLKNQTELRLTGSIDARDLAAFEQLPAGIKSLDLKGVDIRAITMPDRKYFGRTLFAEGEIPSYTFFKTGLSQLVLPDNLTVVGEGAFAGSAITEIVIPEGVTSIGDYAFYGCPSLTSVVLPSTLSSIGKGAFGNCMMLTQVDLSGTKLTAIPERAFAGATQLEQVKLPVSLKRIGREAFSHTGISQLDLSAVSEFDAFALSSMPFLTVLAINPDADIAEGLLMDNISLASLTGLPEYIPDYFAANCRDLDASVINTADAPSIGRYSFANTSAPEELVLAGRIESIGRGAFSGLTNLRKIDATALEDHVPAVDGESFEGLVPADIELWVDDKALQLWQSDAVWSQFNIKSQSQTGIDAVTPDAPEAISILYGHGLITIESGSAVNDVRIYTSDGRVAYVSSPSEQRVEIDTASLPSGVLVVAASDAEGNARTVSIYVR